MCSSQLDNAQIMKVEVQWVVQEIKAGKVGGLDWCAVKSLKSGGANVIER